MTIGNQLANSLAEAAMDDVAVPYSLVHDAWDLLEAAQTAIRQEGGIIDRTAFEEALRVAVETYEDRHGSYQFNPRSMPVVV